MNPRAATPDHSVMPTSIETCALRPWALADKSDLVRNANNRKIWRNLTESFPHPYTEADADHWFSIVGQSGRDIHLAIEFRGSAVGGIGAIAGEGVCRRTCQFGYWLGEPYWGQGIATAAARAFVRHLQDEQLFARLEAPVFQWNPASMRVLEKVGFVREGLLRKSITKDNQLIDSVMYAYLAAVSNHSLQPTCVGWLCQPTQAVELKHWQHTGAALAISRAT